MSLALSACGVTYNAQSVEEAAGDVAVRVVPIDGQSLLLANRSPYTPRQLPSEFYASAGGGGGLRGAGALPRPPFVPTESFGSSALRPPPSAPARAYQIGVGDVISLLTRTQSSALEEAAGETTTGNARTGFTVRDDGAIAIPGVGAVQVAGLTLEEAENRLFTELVENRMDPNISLEIAEFNSKRVSVGGAVGAGQLIPITLVPLTLGDALTRAGGVQAADAEFVTLRVYREGTLYEIPMENYLSDPSLQRIVLQDQDSIFVDTTYDLERAQRYYEQQIAAIGLRRGARADAIAELQAEISLRRAELAERRGNFQARQELGAEERDYVFLAGEVANQTRVPLPYGQRAHLADVLYEAGGFPEAQGDPSQIYVLRAATDPAAFGAVTAWQLDARNAGALTLATRFEMRPDDVIFVAAQPITTWNRALQQFFPVLINAGASAVN